MSPVDNTSKYSLQKNERLLALVGVLILVVIAAVWILYQRPAGLFGKSTSNTSTSTSGQILLGKPILKQLSATTTPEGFPSDFPIEPGAQMISSYNNYFSDTANVIEADRVFFASSGGAASYQFYKNYLQTNGWDINHAGQGPSAIKGLSQGLMISAQKADDTVRIGISWDKNVSGAIVHITYYAYIKK